MPKKVNYDFPILSHIQNKKVPEWGKELWYQKCLIPSHGGDRLQLKFLHIFCISILSNLQQCTCLMVYIWTYGGTRSLSPWIVGTTFYPTWNNKIWRDWLNGISSYQPGSKCDIWMSIKNLVKDFKSNLNSFCTLFQYSSGSIFLLDHDKPKQQICELHGETNLSKK